MRVYIKFAHQIPDKVYYIILKSVTTCSEFKNAQLRFWVHYRSCALFQEFIIGCR